MKFNEAQSAKAAKVAQNLVEHFETVDEKLQRDPLTIVAYLSGAIASLNIMVDMNADATATALVAIGKRLEEVEKLVVAQADLIKQLEGRTDATH